MNNETVYYDYKKDKFVDLMDSDSEEEIEIDNKEKDPDYHPIKNPKFKSEWN